MKKNHFKDTLRIISIGLYTASYIPLFYYNYRLLVLLRRERILVDLSASTNSSASTAATPNLF